MKALGLPDPSDVVNPVDNPAVDFTLETSTTFQTQTKTYEEIITYE